MVLIPEAIDADIGDALSENLLHHTSREYIKQFFTEFLDASCPMSDLMSK